MPEPKRGELILFPKSIENYQAELTNMLEKEAFGEAIALLRFLNACKTEDNRAREEWRMLLEWLVAEFPDAAKAAEEADAEEELDEPELLARTVAGKASQDKHYAGKLLNLLSGSGPIDKQLAALEQLAHIPDEAAAEELLRRLQDTRLHPFVSFKLLQTLARLGVQGEATFARLGEIVTVDIERTPVRPDRFPDPLLAVGERVAEEAESLDPAIPMFAKQTWEEFLMYVYGTSTYRELLRMADDEAVDAWACALHAAVETAMHGGGSGDALLEKYMITASLRPSYERAYGAIAEFFRGASGVLI